MASAAEVAEKAEREDVRSRWLLSAPALVIKRKPASIFDYRFEDFAIEGYDPHPGIPAPIAK